MTVFRSVHHPGKAPAPLVYSRYVMTPLAFCLLPVMIGATAAALQQQPVAPYLLWGVPTAFVVATAWARYQLGATPAEVRVRDHEAAVLSVHECLRQAPSPHWAWIHDIRTEPGALTVTMGFETHRFRYATWPGHHQLLDALRAARSAGPTNRPYRPSHA